MEQISKLPVYAGTIPNKATQSDDEFANNIFGFLNYSGNSFVRDFNVIVGQFNTLSDEIQTAAQSASTNAGQAKTARDEAVGALATLTAGAIDNTNKANNKAYSNIKVDELLDALDLSDIAETENLKHFTATLLTKLNGIAANANNYSHPDAHDASMITESTTKRFVSDEEKASWDNSLDILNKHVFLPMPYHLIQGSLSIVSGALKINDALIPFPEGMDKNGVKNTIVYKDEIITGVTFTPGENYVYAKKDGTYGVTTKAPKYNTLSTIGDYFDTTKNKWFDSAGEQIALSRNYLNHIVYADANSQLVAVKELAKTEYTNIVKVNEFMAKNASTAWINFKGNVIPPVINDTVGFSSVVYVGGVIGYRCYFKTAMDNLNYAPFSSFYFDGSGVHTSTTISEKTLEYVSVNPYKSGVGFVANPDVSILIMGGRN